MALRVSELADLAGVSSDTMPYHEKGLATSAYAYASGYREFDVQLGERLGHQGRARFGLRLIEIRLLPL